MYNINDWLCHKIYKFSQVVQCKCRTILYSCVKIDSTFKIYGFLLKLIFNNNWINKLNSELNIGTFEEFNNTNIEFEQ